MNKILLISISFLVLFVAVASVAATDVNGTVADDSTCAVDGDAIMVATGDAVCDDVTNADIAADVDVNDTISSDVADVDVNDTISSDVADVDVNDTISSDVADVDAVDKVVEIQNVDHTPDSASSDIHHFDSRYPDYIGVTKEKLNSLRGEIDKYANYFKKHRFIQLTNEHYGPHYGVYELILDVYKTHSYDDTVIIASRALTKCGILGLDHDIEDIMNQMRSGTLDVNVYNYNAAHYMKAIKYIESEKNNNGLPWYSPI